MKNIIFEFTVTLYSENEIILGLSHRPEEKLMDMKIVAYGFIVGMSEDYLTNQIIFYN